MSITITSINTNNFNINTKNFVSWVLCDAVAPFSSLKIWMINFLVNAGFRLASMTMY